VIVRLVSDVTNDDRIDLEDAVLRIKDVYFRLGG